MGNRSPHGAFEFRSIPKAPMFFNPPSNLSNISDYNPQSHASLSDSSPLATPMMEIDIMADAVSSPTPCRTPRTTPVPSPEPSVESTEKLE